MLIEVALGGAALAGGAWFWAMRRRARAHGRWALVVGDAAARLGGRASPGSMFDAPELRAEVDGVTVTLKLLDVHLGPRSAARAEAQAGGLDERLRIYIGWDAPQTPEGLSHFPEVVAARGVLVEGRVDIRGSDPEVTRRFAELAARELAELRRATGGRGLEVTCRGGYVELRVLGPAPSAEMLERVVAGTGRMAALIRRAAGGQALSSGAEVARLGPGDNAPGVTCELCTDSKRPGDPWVRCATCAAPYHLGCWHRAGRCVVEGCEATEQRPFEAP